MSKIFSEIKRAIEEEMANQESNRPGAPPRTMGPGGRNVERYREWVEEEQERLRTEGEGSGYGPGGRSVERYDGQEAERPMIDSDEYRPERREPSQERRTRHDRAEARHERRRDDAYAQRRHPGRVATMIRRQLRSPYGVRQAILLSEILGRPVSMRQDDDHLIS